MDAAVAQIIMCDLDDNYAPADRGVAVVCGRVHCSWSTMFNRLTLAKVCRHRHARLISSSEGGSLCPKKVNRNARQALQHHRPLLPEHRGTHDREVSVPFA